MMSVAAAPDTFEFVDQEIRDIVYILSVRSGQPLICDDTVSGRGSFLYVAADSADAFSDAFDAFLQTNKLLVIKEEGLWTVTRIRVDEESDGKISVQSYDSTPAAVFEKISGKTGQAVIYETLPVQRASFSIRHQSVYDTVRLMLQPYSEYTVNETAAGVEVARKKGLSDSSELAAGVNVLCDIRYSNGRYDAAVSNTRISEVLQKVFVHTDESYSLFMQNDDRIKSVSFTEKTLNETLILLLEQVNAEPVQNDGIWYIFPRAERTGRNTVAQRSRSWHTVRLSNMVASKAVPLITARHPGMTVMELSPSLLGIYATGVEHEDISKYIEEIDLGLESKAIRLKYIKTSELVASLPPGITREEITDTGTGNSFFYSGNEEKRNRLMEQLAEIDVPRTLVRYDLLILQYEKSSNLSWGVSTSVRPSEPGDRLLITGEVGNLLNINFDAVTAFGLTFSEKINTAIANNEATVFADTTLYGLSGEKLTFRNTNTYRYKDAAIDSQSGKESFSTITREITSGLVLEIDGWVSGDGMITMQINTSVSKQGVDMSKKNGNPPPTSEKNITTKIRAKNGEPVVLSGLSQSDYSQNDQGVPVLSKIPLLGNLFKSKDKSQTKTEMTIYLLPHIEELIPERGKSSWKEILEQYVRETEEADFEAS